MNTASIRQICSISYTKATLPAAVHKCKTFLKGCDRCICSILPKIVHLKSNDLSFTALEIGRKNCGFCQIKINHLYEMVKTLPFHMIRQILLFDTIKNKNDVLFALLEDHLYSMSKSYIQDIIQHIFQPKKPNQTIIQYIVESDILFILTDIIHKNIERNKKIKQDAVFILFYEIVKYINSFTYDEEFTDDIMSNIWHIFEYIIEESLLDQIDNNVIVELLVMHFGKFKQTIQNSFRKILVKNTVSEERLPESDNWLPNRALIFESIGKTQIFIKNALLEYNRPILNMNYQMYSFILQLPYEAAKTIMSKVTANAMMKLMSSLLSFGESTFELYVNPHDMINTAICYNMNLRNTIQTYLSLKMKPYIVYNNENGQIGVDAGGLTRDFYTQYFLQLKTNVMVECDNYMTFDSTTLRTSLQRIRFAGVITAYSVLVENISPNLRFHPILSYFIINGSTVDIYDLLDFLSKYDIEYIRNIQKLRELTHEEYVLYLDMQGEDGFIPKKQYLHNLLYDRYISPPFIAFVRGYRDIYNQIDLHSYVRPGVIYDFMIGIESYQIMGHQHSLESVLKIECGENTSLSNKAMANIKQNFLEVLDELNRKDIEKMKGLLRFWHGTHGIQDFADLDLTLRILYGKDDLYGCFSSSTCFGKLYIHHSHIESRVSDSIKHHFIGHIERTLENQRIVETAGMYMQMD